MRIAMELVPRDEPSLARQIDELGGLARVDAVNVPDLAHFRLRGWQAALQVRRAGRWAAVPHLRAMDVDPTRPWTPAEALTEAGVNEVLVVTGDPPSELGHATTGAKAVEVIRALKRAHPDWKVYAALDPYRAGFSEERDYALRKLDAGADGFFTQPFFDLRLLGVWHDLMRGVPVHWGVTSVTSERTMHYWLSRNRAVFPHGFAPTLAWHRRFAAEALAFAEHHDADLYFMPIRVDVRHWLGDLLANR